MPAAPAAPPAPPAPKAVPVAETAQEKDEEDDPHDESWRQYIEEDSETEPEESGEDSDADLNTAHERHADRHKNDMDLLAKMQAKAKPAPKSRSPKGDALGEPGASAEKEEQNATAEGKAWISSAEQEVSSPAAAAATSTPTGSATPGSAAKKSKGGFMSRLFGSKKNAADYEAPAGSSMLNEDISKQTNEWYEEWIGRFSKDGVLVTKVARTGKPSERRVYLDSRNMTLEVRGGRTGSGGILMDDLVDVRRGMTSFDFEQFQGRLNVESSVLDTKALVLQTPHRTFSLLLADRKQRDTLGMCLLHLLKTKNRGVMATPSASSPVNKKPSQGPKQGPGKVTYANRSTYEGQFQNFMRHGKGVLTLSDGTKYDSEWKNDERHGEGKELCPDGTTFEGSYGSGMRHGYGVMTWPEGSKYSGKFERGRANGEGELLRTDGSVYRGQFQEDCMSGQGKMQWRDGVEYVGQFVSNKREGFGTMCWTSGRWQKYTGSWKDGMQHEQGTLVDHNGQEFKGFFRLGKLDYWMEDQMG